MSRTLAIVGTGCLLPSASSPEALWELVVEGRVVVDRVPNGRWRVGSHSRVGPHPDQARSDRGGYVRVDLSSCEGDARIVDPLVRWPLHAATQALRGVTSRERTAIVLGNLSFPSEAMSAFAESHWLSGSRIHGVAPPETEASERFMSGRPAHALNAALGWSGEVSYALDAACASGLYALAFACDALLDGHVDLALAGAVNRADDLFLHIGFSALGAMSASGQSRPFHRDADGLLPAEGAAMIAVKRLDDALRDGDPVLALIRGVGLSNDGRGRSFLKPDERGQVRAMRRAWRRAQRSPDAVGWVECHATGTPVGDGTELRSLQRIIGAEKRIAIGSLKANLGHLITAAGSAAIVKVVEALRRGVLPPQPHADAPIELADGRSFSLLDEAHAWEGERLAGISAFGFGGNNAHVVLESWADAPVALPAPRPVAAPGFRATVRGVGVCLGDERGFARMSELLEDATSFSPRAQTLRVPMGGAPPDDLRAALAQQTLLLDALTQVQAQLDAHDPGRIAVFIGMGADAEVARFGLRWRLASAGVEDLDGITPSLTPAGVVGAMPNMPANRLNRVLDAGALGVTIASEELSGVDALSLAIRALAAGECDCALVGAVDLSCEPVHNAARRELGLEGQALDAAVLLVLTRDVAGMGQLSVARDATDLPATTDVARQLGVSHATSGLLEVVGALSGPPGARRDIVVQAWTGQRRRVRVTPLRSAAHEFSEPARSLRLDAHAPPVRLPASPSPASEPPTATPAALSPETAAADRDAPPATIPDIERADVAPKHTAASPLARADAPRAGGAPPPGAGTPATTQQQAGLPDAPSALAALPSAPWIPPTTLAPAERGRPLQASPPQAAVPFRAPARARRGDVQPTAPAARPTAWDGAGREAPPRDTEQRALSVGGRPSAEALADQLVAVHTAHLEQRAFAQQRFLQTMDRALASYFTAFAAQSHALPPAPLATPEARAPLAPPLVPARPVNPAPPLNPAPRITPASPVEADGAPSSQTYPGPRFSRAELEQLASGRISALFGPAFADQDAHEVQVRMPEPPMLLCDRVLGIDAAPHSMSRGTIWTETDVTRSGWYLRDGVMPAGLMIESGQADLLLISWLGIDRYNAGERAYRLLGCELTYHGGLPKPGETLRYDIHVDGHARQGDVRMFFFHYDCRVDGQVRLAVRGGQAGFFTREELDASMGVLWSPDEGPPTDAPRLDAGPALTEARAFDAAAVHALRSGDLCGVLGAAFWQAQTHTRTPTMGRDRFAMFQRVDAFEPHGGPWGRGYVRATHEVRPEDWFFEGHFKNDPCMPGTLMLEGCLDTVALVLTAHGFTLDRDGWRFEPVPDVPYHLRCRGQVTPQSKVLTYEVFVDEIVDGERPTVWADVLCTVDGLKAFHCSRLGVQLVPGWPTEGRAPRAVSDRASASIGTLPIDERAMQATAIGKPSAAFGPAYSAFDRGTGVPRLPGAPFLFVDRATHIEGAQDQRAAGTRVTTEFDVAPSAWFFEQTPCGAMPWCVLLEAALQPCGWLASYTGGALGTDATLFFRNLDGNAEVVRQVSRESVRLTTDVTCTRFARSGDTTIVAFDVTMRDVHGPILSLDTVFGFFTGPALARQVGLHPPDSLTAFERTGPLREVPCWPEGAGPAREALRVLHEVRAIDAEGGAAGLGIARGRHRVSPSDWFFRAHFFRDPVMPGSLGLEALRQLAEELLAAKTGTRWTMDPIGVGAPASWTYRGQVIPSRTEVDLRVELLTLETKGARVRAEVRGALWCDGVPIYELKRFPMTGRTA